MNVKKLEHIVDNAIRRGIEIQADLRAIVPSMVLIYPVDQHYLRSGFINQKWVLKLCCMYPGREHPLDAHLDQGTSETNPALGVYYLEDLGEFTGPVIKWMRGKAGIIKVAFPALGRFFEWVNKDEVARVMESVGEKSKSVKLPESPLPKGGGNIFPVSSEYITLAGLDEDDYREVEGQGLVFLEQVFHKYQPCGNLKLFITEESRLLWLCNEHYDRMASGRNLAAAQADQTIRSLFQKVGDLQFAKTASAIKLRAAKIRRDEVTCAHWDTDADNESSWVCKVTRNLADCEQQLRRVCQTYGWFDCVGRVVRKEYWFQGDPVGISYVIFDASLTVRNETTLKQNFSLVKVGSSPSNDEKCLIYDAPLRDEKWAMPKHPLSFDVYLKENAEGSTVPRTRFTISSDEEITLDMAIRVKLPSFDHLWGVEKLVARLRSAQAFAEHIKNGLSGLWIKVERNIGNLAEHEFSISWSEDSNEIETESFDVDQLESDWKHLWDVAFKSNLHKNT